MKAIQEISSLRFIFIIAIFLHHTLAYTGGGYLGVEFFFILGGFVMTLGYKDRVSGSAFSYKSFIFRRIAKYYPLHWLCLAAILILFLFTGEFGKDKLGPLMLNAALLQSWIPVKKVYFSFNAPSWYLSSMLFLVAVFPVLLKGLTAILKSKAWTIVFLAALFSAYLALFATLKDEYRHFGLYINPLVRLVDYILGILSAFLFLSLRDGQKVPASAAVPLRILMYGSLGVLILLSIVLPTRYLMCSLIFAPLVCALLILVSLEPVGGRSVFSWKPLVFLGGFSFEIYMIHGVCLRYFDYLKNNFTEINEKLLYVPVYLALTLLLAIACRKLFVVPVSRYLIGSDGAR